MPNTRRLAAAIAFSARRVHGGVSPLADMERVIFAGAENVSVSSVGVPVAASGGAGRPEHLVEAFRDAKADATIVAGMVHTEGYTIAEIKKAPVSAAISARICW